MRHIISSKLGALALLMAAAAASSSACRASEPRTEAERLARGRKIVERMSNKLGSVQSLSVTTRETREQIKASGETQPVTLTRETIVRRPDRLYAKASGDVQTEVWYDGVGLTVAMHKDKVFGQARMPETLDKMLDAMHERYGVATPLADFLYASPAKALLTDTTKGGWVGRETIDGQATDHLSFTDKGVNWEIWIAATGDPLPRKSVATFSEDKRLRKVELTFSDWNFAPQFASDRFTPKVPADYEGIAIVQRARVLRNIPEGEEGAESTTGGVKK
jgi:hypothetical protein